MTHPIIKQLQPLAAIAKGRYSSIYKYINMNTTDIFAVKKHPKVILGYKKECIVREKEALEYLKKHKNIIEYYGYIEDEDDGYFILEFVNGYDLNRVISESKYGAPEKQVNDTLLIKYLLNVLDGLQHLHSQNVYHCDVKPENIVVWEDKAKIVDFGSAIMSDKQIINVRSEDFLGTPGFVPPEVADHSYRSDVDLEFVDLFGFGCTLYYCFVKFLPFNGMLSVDVSNNVINMKVDLSKVKNEAIKEILNHILTKDNLQRWSLEQVKNRLTDIYNSMVV